jgi:hypothetical protein
MALPEHLERLKHISIDTLGLSESTEVVLKWYGLTHVLDCISQVYITIRFRRNSDPWPRIFMLLFGEVRLKLIAAGHWDLVMDAEVWRILHEQTYQPPIQRIVHWQGRDQDLYAIPLEQLGLYDAPFEVRFLKDIGACINHFLYDLSSNSKHSLKIDKYNNPYREPEPDREFDEYMWGQVQPRLVEMGLWTFVEAHLDDYIEEKRVDEDAGEET